MKAVLKSVKDGDKVYNALVFVCPGCIVGWREGYSGVHMLPVNVLENIGKPSWDWNGSLESPTLSPSIRTRIDNMVCHSFLQDGVFDFLTDSTHPLSGQKVPLPDLPPEWIED